MPASRAASYSVNASTCSGILSTTHGRRTASSPSCHPGNTLRLPEPQCCLSLVDLADLPQIMVVAAVGQELCYSRLGRSCGGNVAQDFQPLHLALKPTRRNPAHSITGRAIVSKKTNTAARALHVKGLCHNGAIIVEAEVAVDVVLNGGMSWAARSSTRLFLFSSGMQLPRGLLKFDTTRHALMELCSIA